MSTDSPSPTDTTTLSPQLFDVPLKVAPAPWLTVDTFEDLQLCMRYALQKASDRYSMETAAQAWFGVVLESLGFLRFTLYEHTKRTLTYESSRAALKDVYDGFLPPPREQGPFFRAVDEANTAPGSDPGLRNISVFNASSHLSIVMDCEDDNVPVAILFFVHCVTDPIAPTKRLNLMFDHLGARFDSVGFSLLRAQVESEHREKLIAVLKKEL
ncbi:hypothetical protein [Pseudomonas sp. NBRC 111131]|uniref:hypothetical protein n=1 Tax=Pseudomonas sp. NBRC 111131 TaxID=1661046 RepID=UPI0006D3BFE1|nr:hypothetical protein [Pseudomonas sp. NBRC 111131]